MSGPSTVCVCDYCGLPFTGNGYSPDGERRYCCYGCHLVCQIVQARQEEGIATWLLLRLGIGAFLAMNVMMLSLVLYTTSEAELGAVTVRAMHWAMLVLSTPVLLILGTPFVVGGAKELTRGRIGMDILVATGSISAYCVSALHTVRGAGHVYFDTATMLLLIVTLGRLLEAAAKSRASGAIRDVLALLPDTARVLRNSEETQIPTSEVRENDLMVVKPGERIPADGRIESGSCLVMESAFSGESRPRACRAGDMVYGGSVDCDGLIYVVATAVGEDSLLEQIQRMVRRAQQDRVPIERVAERIAGGFVPAVWLAAIGAGLYWGALHGDAERASLSALAVLVVACPCALGLATPIATSLAIGRAARSGVLIRSGEALERLPAVETILFDKTGTLTTNALSVDSITTASDDVAPEEALAWAAAVESGSEHVIARAIVEEARTRGAAAGTLLEFKAIPGLGAEGTVRLGDQTRRVTVGSRALVRPDLPRTSRVPSLSKDAPDSLTTAYVGWDGAVQARIALADTARPEAAEAVAALKSAGIKTGILSGDRRGPTERVAAELGLDEVIAECSPAEKLEALRRKREGSRGAVAVVGDGINDAPALAEADVGIAIGGGTDLARLSSDVTLMGDDLSRIPDLLALSRFAYRVIKQNLWWAFGYNSVAITLAFLGWVHPLIAATAMLASSATVIANSMRILRTPEPLR